MKKFTSVVLIAALTTTLAASLTACVAAHSHSHRKAVRRESHSRHQ